MSALIEDLEILATHYNAVVRFYVDDDTPMLRVALEDETGDHLTVVKRVLPETGFAAVLGEAVQAALTEFTAQQRRALMRAI